jgi:phosphotransferase system  glucose/maltose/N-acetylglucosamine-specific IIC component
MRTLFTDVWSKVNELNHSTTQVLLLIVMAFYLLTYGLLFYGHDLQFLIIFFQIEKEKEQKSKQFKKENEEKINTIQDIESCKFMSMYFL